MSFEAKYPGMCDGCGERIVVGDGCEYDDRNNVLHLDCDGDYPPERVEVVCTECWIIKPCDCDYSTTSTPEGTEQ